MVPKSTLDRLGFKAVRQAAGIQEYRLPKNGLKVLLKEDHKAPVATLMVVYRVGSRHEGAGWTGSAHFFEHLMFKGTRAFDPLEGNGLDDITGRIGAEMNANTYYDRTLYFEVMPCEHLALCMRLEADRMRGLKNRVSDRDSEMTVVRNEFERGENNPGSALYKAVMGAAYGEHQYTWPVIGYLSDVEGVSMNRMVSSLYDQYYWPNNATVIAVGDFDSADALAQINRYFGRIPRSPQPIPHTYTLEPRQEGERRVQVCRPGSQPQVMIGFHIPAATDRDIYAINVAAAILGGRSATSRLYKALIETSKSTGASASTLELRDPGMFLASAQVAPGASLEEIEALLTGEIDRLKSEPVTPQELERVKAQNRKGTVFALDDPKNLADQLGEAEAIADWTWSVHYDDNFDAVTADDVMRVAGKYFRQTNRTVGQFIPSQPETDDSGDKVQAQAPKARRERTHKQRRLEIENNPRATSYGDKTITRTLSNGLTVHVLPQGNGQVAVSGAIVAGDYFGEAGKSIVPSLVSQMLTAGTERFTKEQIADTLVRMGTGLGVSAAQYTANFTQLVATEDLPQFIDLLADVLRRPAFAEVELQRTKQMFQAWVTRSKNDTGETARNEFMRAAYPDGHPLRPVTFDETAREIAAVTADDLKGFHARYFVPKSTVLTFVGDVDADAVCKLLETHFGSWQGGERPQIAVAEVAAPTAACAEPIKVVIPGKANVDIVIGHPTTIARTTSKDYFAAMLANMVLGGDTISGRLGSVIRDKHGLTYGINSRIGGSGQESFGAAPWLITVSVNPANIDKTLGLINQVMADYATNGIGELELSDSVCKMLGKRVVAMRSGAAIATVLRDLSVLGFAPAELDSISQRYLNLTKADVDAAIRKYLTLDGAVTVIAGTFAR